MGAPQMLHYVLGYNIVQYNWSICLYRRSSFSFASKNYRCRRRASFSQNNVIQHHKRSFWVVIVQHLNDNKVHAELNILLPVHTLIPHATPHIAYAYGSSLSRPQCTLNLQSRICQPDPVVIPRSRDFATSFLHLRILLTNNGLTS